jgi:hypothetical protein
LIDNECVFERRPIAFTLRLAVALVGIVGADLAVPIHNRRGSDRETELGTPESGSGVSPVEAPAEGYHGQVWLADDGANSTPPSSPPFDSVLH